MPIQVWVTSVKKRGKREYVARWLKPDGKPGQRNLGTGIKREANRRADRVEAELNAQAEGVPWRIVKKRFEAEVLAGLKGSGTGKWRSATNKLAAFADPASLFELDTDLLSRFGAHLRELGLATETVRGYLAEINRTLTWAETVWHDYHAPKIRKPRTYGRKAKGRPITGEEFERILENVPKLLEAKYVESWQHTLRGFWLSGLRLSEIHGLRWDRGAFIVKRIETNHPRLHIAAGEDKGGRAERLPMWHFPDLVEFLRQTPEGERRGFVFNPMLKKGRASQQSLGKLISRFGGQRDHKEDKKKKLTLIVVARVLAVDKKTGKEYPKTKFASAHTFRASFGTRWAPKIERELLRRWMRHRHYQTTDQYYVDIDLDAFDRQVPVEAEAIEKEV